VLALAVLLHAGIGFFMGMTAFGLAMLTGCLAFADAGSIRRFAARCSSRLARRTRTAAAATMSRAA
jgi:hypothetical protein